MGEFYNLFIIYNIFSLTELPSNISHNDVIYPSPIFPSNEWNELRDGKIRVRGKDFPQKIRRVASTIFRLNGVSAFFASFPKKEDGNEEIVV